MSDHLYIHIPFCLKKCGYCDFYSLETPERLAGFLPALEAELRLRAPEEKWRPPVSTLYFGGGTPSLVPLYGLDRVLDVIHDLYQVSDQTEITLEANPGTLDADYLEGLQSLGINRLSLGLQSFSGQKLKVLGRVHDEDQGRAAIDLARKAGFENVGLDLIYGLPGEGARDWQQEMKEALTYGPEHLSCYMLTLEPGTALYGRVEAGEFHPMAPSDQADLFSLTSETLGAAGYDHYEISNFAAGHHRRSRHNSAYWQMRPYAGFGPSAHSLTFDTWKPAGSEGAVPVPVRSWNMADLDGYLVCLNSGRLPTEETEVLTPAQQMAELVMVGLRTREGMDISLFDALSDHPFLEWFPGLLDDLKAQGLGRVDGHRFALTLEGWTRLDSIVAAFAGQIL